MPKFTVCLVNDNGHKTGIGKATIEYTAPTRQEAQQGALRHQRERSTAECAWRLHDVEKAKA